MCSTHKKQLFFISLSNFFRETDKNKVLSSYQYGGDNREIEFIGSLL